MGRSARGVGENGAAIRAGAAVGLPFLGVRIDDRVNGSAAGDAKITASGRRGQDA